MAKVGSALQETVDTIGFDENLNRGFEAPSSNTELEERTGYSYEQLADLVGGGTPSSFVTSIVFSSTDADTVAWTSGSLNYQDGTKFTIASGNTGNISARTYIYFNPGLSPATLKQSTALVDAVSDGGVLLAIATNNSDTTGKATLEVIGSSGSYPTAVSTSHLETGIMKVPLVMTPTSNTTSLVKVNQADGTNLVAIDSTNFRVGFNSASPAKFFDINSNSNTQAVRLYGINDSLTESHFPDTQSGTWLSMQNIESSNNVYATSNAISDHEMILTDCSFTAVAGTIVGIEVLVEAKSTGSRSISVKLSGNAGSTYSSIKDSGGLTGSDVNYTLGSSTDLWGYVWTAAMFSNANFKISLTNTFGGGAATTSVDFVQVTVYYTTSSAPSTTQIADIFVGSGGSLVFDLTPGSSTTQFIDFRPEDNQYGLVLRESDGTGTTVLANFYVVDSSPDYLSINVTGVTTTAALNITSGNDVGIGTAVPGAKLHVLGSNSAGIRIEGAANNELADLYVGSEGQLTINMTAGSDTSGRIEMLPEDDQYGLIIYESDGTGTAVFGNFYVVDAATDYLSITIGATSVNALNILSTNRVGIGTATPSTKLEIAGVTTSDNFISDVTTGTQPYATTSTTLNTNLNADLVDSVHVAALTTTRLLRYNSSGTQIENATVTETSGALGGITTISMSGQLTSTLATGTAPMVIASTTKVTNLNVDSLDDQSGAYYLDSANFTGTNWTDLTDGGNTTLHVHTIYYKADGSVPLNGPLDHDGTTIGFFSTTPTTKQTALTTQLTSITHTAPGTPDYAIQDLTSTSPFGFVTQDEGNTVLSVILNLQTRVQQLETKLQAYGLLA